ncbi:MAG TPA: ATP-binding cassette domain-containing protein [Burkholderiales bacterium]|nr:ATP-binding cassette domain-containing protein [Burkholderiales bacterium]
MADKFMPPIVRAAGLTKQVFTGTSALTILTDVSFEIERGEAVAILGASGSGKTTLLALLAGLDVPTSGTVDIDGQDLFALDEDGRARLRRKRIGFVFQSFQLLPALTALENVMLPLELAANPDAKNRASDWLARVGLGQRITHYPRQLSGGEQQRVAVARAFAADPQLLLADEPTGNLDSATGEEIISLMFELNRVAHTTLLLVTHDELLARRCPRRIGLVAGRLSSDERR